MEMRAFKKYVEDVRKGSFPEEKHYFKLKSEEEKKFREPLS